MVSRQACRKAEQGVAVLSATGFFRFPSTPHLAWLGQGGPPRDDKLLSEDQAIDLLREIVTVEEKVDGANIGISLTLDDKILLQNRGQYILEPFAGQFKRIPPWIAQHEQQLREILSEDIMLFGEWCAARHSITYSHLSDWFLLFDVYDRPTGRFWSSQRRDELARAAGISTVPLLQRSRVNLSDLKEMLRTGISRYSEGLMEGLIIRQESEGWCNARAKLVSADFVQAIGEHWSRRRIVWNKIDWQHR